MSGSLIKPCPASLRDAASLTLSKRPLHSRGCPASAGRRGALSCPAAHLQGRHDSLPASSELPSSSLFWHSSQQRCRQLSSRKRRREEGLGCRTAAEGLGALQEDAAAVPLARSLPLERAPEEALSLPEFLHALYKFTRPHTMFGTCISVVSVSLLALDTGGFSAAALYAVTSALVPALLMNVSIVGLNQVFDVAIDKVNKPYLPLASGEFSMQTAVGIVVGTGLAALGLGLLVGSTPLTATLMCSLALGIAYSTDLPFLRWKQNPLAAAACILAVRAVLVQLGFWLHMKVALGAPLGALKPSPPLLFAMGLMVCFSIVIALFKDIPDVRGDRQEGVRTLSVRVGAKGVFWSCIGILEAAYLGAICVGLLSKVWWSRAAIAGGHAVLGALLWRRAQRVDLRDSASIASCYMYLWKLFYAEYLLVPLLR